jgi:hypothetical protein
VSGLVLVPLLVCHEGGPFLEIEGAAEVSVFRDNLGVPGSSFLDSEVSSHELETLHLYDSDGGQISAPAGPVLAFVALVFPELSKALDEALEAALDDCRSEALNIPEGDQY